MVLAGRISASLAEHLCCLGTGARVVDVVVTVVALQKDDLLLDHGVRKRRADASLAKAATHRF